MRIFVTGATGFVGSAITQDLLAAGHQVLALARTDKAAATLTGVDVHRGDVQDIDSLQRGAAACDAVVHTAFIHDFARFAEVCEIDRRAIEALGDALAGTPKRLLVTSGTGLLAPGRTGVEEDKHAGVVPRVASEHAADAVARRGVHGGVVRLPPSVHGAGDHGFVPMLIELAKKRGVSAYVGDGANRWPAVHRLDAARLYRLAIERDLAPGTRLHAVAEQGVPFREIAEVIGRRLNLPVVSKTRDEANAHFEFLAHFAAADMRASGAQTQERLAWQPAQAGLIADVDANYF